MGTLRYKGYIGTVEYSTDDNILHGKIHGINDLVTYEGKSTNEIKKTFTEAVEDYLETCRSVKKEPDKTYKGVFNVRIEPDLHRKAAVVAQSGHITLNDFVKRAVSYAVDHEKELLRSIAAEPKERYGKKRERK